jgi:hypothetical protein
MSVHLKELLKKADDQLDSQAYIIKVLASKLQEAQGDKISAIAKERKRWAREDLVSLEIRDLEQQAKGAIKLTNIAMKKLEHPKCSQSRLEYFKAGVRALAFAIDKESKALKDQS